jgi:Flp pilus assembly protein TadG
MLRVQHNRRGAAAVEFALLLPLLTLLFAVAVDWSRIFYYSITIENCARNGAIYARDPYSMVQSPYPDITAAALADASNLSPQPKVSSKTGTSGSYSYVECTVTYSFKTLTHFPAVPTTTDLSRTVRVYLAPQAPAMN